MDDPRMNSIYVEQIKNGLEKDIRKSWEKHWKEFSKMSKAEQNRRVLEEVNRQSATYLK
jgi:hypothetical protein